MDGPCQNKTVIWAVSPEYLLFKQSDAAYSRTFVLLLKNEEKGTIKAVEYKL
jgi:hypothetical protein